MRGLHLESKAILVTGAASGIGAAVVVRLLEEGARVAAVDRTAIDVASEHVGRVVALQADVTKQPEVDAAIARAVKEFGRIDGIAHCAGITADNVVWKLTDEEWQRVLDVNLTGSFRVVRAAVPAMRATGGGSIVLMASVNGLRGMFGQANYAASKAGVIGLAKSVAQEAGAFGIRVNAVAPGYVKTPMTATVPPKFMEEALRTTPLGRLAEPGDIADVILFLLSPLARHLSGTVIRVDGGQCTGA